MGSLNEIHGSQSITLEPENLVGRSPRCGLRLTSGHASSVHASIRWTPRGWELKDLSSTNGSFLNGRRLPPGRAQILSHGDIVAFGAAEPGWRLADDHPPHPVVIGEDGERARGGDLIAVPSAEEPRATLYRSSDGSWCIEHFDCTVQRIEHGEVFEAGGRRWRFVCPELITQTDLVREHDARETSLVFEVSRDEEHVALLAQNASATIDLGVRTANYLLLFLARQRQRDDRAGVEEQMCGWVHQDALARALATEPENINVDVFRIRKRFERHFRNAAQVIERRPRTGQLRLGICKFEIRSLEHSEHTTRVADQSGEM